jgi:hypothetical protein
VRISGIVVAVNEQETRHFYTIDDGSGATLECVVNVPKPAPGTSAAVATSNAKSNQNSSALPAIDAPIDVGHALDIKGSVGEYRWNKQIRAEKIVHLNSTEQEVIFWEKVTQLKRDVISKPWVLDRLEVRKCKKEEEGRSSSRRHRGTSERHGRRRVEGTGLERRGSRKTGLERAGLQKTGMERAGLQKTGLEKAGLQKTGLEKAALRKTVLQKTVEHKTGLEKTAVLKTGLEKVNVSHGEENRSAYGQGGSRSRHERKPLAGLPVRETGLERRRATKPATTVLPVRGNYDALGL